MLNASYARSRSRPCVSFGTDGSSSRYYTLMNTAAYSARASAVTWTGANLNGVDNLNFMMGEVAWEDPDIPGADKK